MFDSQIAFFGFCGLIIFIIFDLIKNKKHNVIRRVIMYSFIVYVLKVLDVTIGMISIPPHDYVGHYGYYLQLVPFYFVADILAYETGSFLFWNTIRLSFFNFLLLIPLGVYLAVLFRVNGLKQATTIVFMSTLSIEMVQFFFSITGISTYGRTFNVDDLILNTIGGVVGFVVARSLITLWMRRNA
ncbi:VanZ family protein [Alteribacter aurantiacus]|uniref:VanZ family protein n=1 Tax=Alteribacter aurantiacus TaxID=254410 RepID=UPI000419330D|nr:VanZ family protein [Alteribacter aurantiacus]